MRIGDERELAKHIKLGFLEKVYFLCSTEQFLVRRYGEALVKQAVGENPGDFDLHVLEGKDADMQKVSEAALQLPLFSQRTCVWVKGLDPEGVAAAQRGMLAELLEQLGTECVLLFTFVSPDAKKLKSAKSRPLFSLVEKNGCLVLLQPREGRDLNRFLHEAALQEKVLFEAEECDELIARAGTDMETLRHETEKLCAYVGAGGKITREAIELVCCRSVNASIYDLSKLVLQGDYGAAMEKLDDLFALREAPVGILAALSSHFLDLYRVSVLREARLPADKAGELFSYGGRAFVLRNAARDSARIPIGRLRACLGILSRTDLALKSSSADDRVRLEQAVTELIVAVRGG